MSLEGKLVPVVLFPRFTTFSGALVTYYTFPLDVSLYEGVRLTFWRGPVVTATSATLNFHIEVAMVRDQWRDLTTPFDIGPETEEERTYSFEDRWFRIGARIETDPATVTCWVQGFLIRRER